MGYKFSQVPGVSLFLGNISFGGSDNGSQQNVL